MFTCGPAGCRRSSPLCLPDRDSIALAVDKVLSPEGFAISTVRPCRPVPVDDHRRQPPGRALRRLSLRRETGRAVLFARRRHPRSSGSPALPEIDEAARRFSVPAASSRFTISPKGRTGGTSDDYLAYVSQLAKLRMNFIGLHCYPEGGVGPGAAVWIGQTCDLRRRGDVRSAPLADGPTPRGRARGVMPP